MINVFAIALAYLTGLFHFSTRLVALSALFLLFGLGVVVGVFGLVVTRHVIDPLFNLRQTKFLA